METKRIDDSDITIQLGIYDSCYVIAYLCDYTEESIIKSELNWANSFGEPCPKWVKEALNDDLESFIWTVEVQIDAEERLYFESTSLHESTEMMLKYFNKI